MGCEYVNHSITVPSHDLLLTQTRICLVPTKQILSHLTTNFKCKNKVMFAIKDDTYGRIIDKHGSTNPSRWNFHPL